MWSSQRGASIVEVIVAFALLSIAILAGSSYIDNIQSARNIRKLQTTIRFLAIQATLEATGNFRYYPPVNPPDATTQPLYVACFSNAGDKVQNNTPAKGRDFQFYLAANYKEDQASGACSKETAAFEVRFFWLSPFQSDINVNIFNLQPRRGETTRTLFKNFKIFAK